MNRKGHIAERILFDVIDGKPQWCVEITLDGGGVVRTRWCDNGDEARAEARAGYVRYVEDMELGEKDWVV